MKKVRISELSLYSSLKGLYTIGTDENNNSVKVSLEWLAEEGADAKAAAEAANQAATSANSAASSANSAADSANAAASSATSAASSANSAATSANEAASAANNAATSANEASERATEAAEAAEAATEETEAATEAANEATEKVLETLATLVPEALEVEYPSKITYGNQSDLYVLATLLPETVLNNVIFQSDNKSVTVAPDGKLTIVGTGTTVIYVIPTCNTAIYKTIRITVTMPGLRLVTAGSLRFTMGGGLRFT